MGQPTLHKYQLHVLEYKWIPKYWALKICNKSYVTMYNHEWTMHNANKNQIQAFQFYLTWQ